MYSLMMNRDRAEKKAVDLKDKGRKVAHGPKQRKAKRRYQQAFKEYVELEKALAKAKDVAFDNAIEDDESIFSDDSSSSPDDSN